MQYTHNGREEERGKRKEGNSSSQAWTRQQFTETTRSKGRVLNKTRAQTRPNRHNTRKLWSCTLQKASFTSVSDCTTLDDSSSRSYKVRRDFGSLRTLRTLWICRFGNIFRTGVVRVVDKCWWLLCALYNSCNEARDAQQQRRASVSKSPTQTGLVSSVDKDRSGGAANGRATQDQTLDRTWMRARGTGDVWCVYTSWLSSPCSSLVRLLLGQCPARKTPEKTGLAPRTRTRGQRCGCVNLQPVLAARFCYLIVQPQGEDGDRTRDVSSPDVVIDHEKETHTHTQNQARCTTQRSWRNTVATGC